jgi:hypothetical protein
MLHKLYSARHCCNCPSAFMALTPLCLVFALMSIARATLHQVPQPPKRQSRNRVPLPHLPRPRHRLRRWPSASGRWTTQQARHVWRRLLVVMVREEHLPE